MKINKIALFVCANLIAISTYAQFSKKDVIAATEFTFYILSSDSVHTYLPELYLCKNGDTHYHATNFSKSSEPAELFLTFSLGSKEQAVQYYRDFSSIIESSDANLSQEITDANGVSFLLKSPQDDNRIGQFIIIQKKGDDDWGIISKNHIRNMFRIEDRW